MLARHLITILPAMTLTDAIETTPIHRVAGRTGEHRISADLVGVESTHTAQVDRERAPMPPGETCPLPFSTPSAPCHGCFSQ
jgi:predicted ATPase with chaperone activity